MKSLFYSLCTVSFILDSQVQSRGGGGGGMMQGLFQSLHTMSFIPCWTCKGRW